MLEDAPREHLVVLESPRAAGALAELKKVANVTQILPPRLVLIRADAEVREQASRIDGVLGVYDGPPGEILPELAPAERVFISAWESRQQPKTRPGDQLAWDASGYVAPDAPNTDDDDSTRENST